MSTHADLSHMLGLSFPQHKLVFVSYSPLEKPTKPAEKVDDTPLSSLMDEIVENYNDTNGWASLNPSTAEQAYKTLFETAEEAALLYSKKGAGSVCKQWKNRFGGTHMVEIFPFAKGP